MEKFSVGDRVMTMAKPGEQRLYGTVKRYDKSDSLRPVMVHFDGRNHTMNRAEGDLALVPDDEAARLRLRLTDSGWTMSDSIGGNQRWKKGTAAIELMSDGAAFFCFSDRRMKNGTHAAIVGEFAARDYQSEREYRLERLLEELRSHFDDEGNVERDADLYEAYVAYEGETQ